MAHLWLRDDAEGWAVWPLEGEAFALEASPPQNLTRDELVPSAVLLRSGDGRAPRWVLVAGAKSEVYLNGLRVSLGIRVIRDRDEIRVGDAGACFFSTETLARVAAFPGAERKTFCPRCRMDIEQGTLAVLCPNCRVWYHSSAEMPCWSYAANCVCGHPTDLNTGFQWMPEEL